MVRNILCFFLFLFVSCTSSSVPTRLDLWMEQNGKMKILSTTQMIDDLVEAVGGERVDHLALIQGEIDPHSYELVKGDDEKLSFADVVFGNGLQLEHGASLKARLDNHPHFTPIGDVIFRQEPEKFLYIDGVLDPHIWMDISLWVCAVDVIEETLSMQDPAGEKQYKQRAEQLKNKMLVRHDEIQTRFAAIPQEKRYLVTSHNAFNYFTRAYLCPEGWERERCEAPEGLAPDGQLGPSDIQRIVDHLCLHKISVVFSESNVSRDSLRKIVSCCLEKGVRVRICQRHLYGDSMGQEARNYLEMITHNASVIEDEWLRN
jgi:manganese/zinc/iron transport system substrate-binding protein